MIIMKKKLLLLLCAVMALTVGPAFGADPDTRTMKISLVIPNAVPVLSATNTTQTIKKGDALKTITVTATAGDWITWTNTLPSDWTDSADYDTKKYTLTPPASPNLTVNSTNTYTVTAKNDSGDAVQNITITVKGSNVDAALTNSKGEFTGTRGTPAATTDSSTGASTTKTTTTFSDTYSRQLLTADVAVTSESTDFKGIAGVEFAHTFSVDVTLDLKDTDYNLYSYSLDVAGLPDWLTLGGTVTADEDFATPKHHEFTLTGTPSAKADAVTLVFTATVKVSGDNPVLVALGSKDVKVSVGDAVLVSLDAEISCDPLTLDVGSTGSVTAGLTVKGKFSDGSTLDLTDYTKTWSTASNDIAGITFADGVLSVAATAKAGVYNFPIKAAVTRGEFEATAEAVVKVTVNDIAPAGLSADSTNITAKSGDSISVKATLTSGTNIVWSTTGTLPSGLTVTSDDNSLTISGTASESDAGQTFEVTVKASNTAGDASVTITFTISANDTAPVLPASTVSWTAKTGESFSEAITATAGTNIAWSFTGTLPSGLTASSADKTFTVSGTPADGTAGEYTLTVKAANSAGEASAAVTLTVSNAGGSGDTGDTGDTGDSSITSTTGNPSTRTTSDGMSITGTQTVFTYSSGAALASIDIDITAASTDFVVNAGSAFSQVFSVDVEVQIVSTDYDAYSYDVEIAGLPDWLSVGGETSYTAALDASNGMVEHHHQFTLSGTPASSAAKQNVVLTAKVELSGGAETLKAAGSKDVNITVASETGELVPELSITSASWDLKVGEAFEQSITASSESSVTWSFTGTLPAGLSITSQDKTLTLSGTPATGSTGTYDLTITAANGAGSASAAITLRVASETGELVPELSITSASWDLKVGEAFEQSITATSYSTVTWDITGTLPSGITASSSDETVASSVAVRVSAERTYTLTLSGTPAAGSAGTYDLTITAANNAGNASIPITFTVANADSSPNSNDSNNYNPSSGGNNDTPSTNTDYTPSNPDADVVVTPTGDAYAIADDGSLEVLASTSGNLSDVLAQMTPEQKANITSIKINDSITDLSGLSGLSNLEELDLSDASSLTNADLSGNTSIKTVTIEGNTSIVSLNLSGSTVETVNAKNCGNITEVNVQGCNNLITLDVSNTNIAELNADDCSNLQALYCENCKITRLSIENCWKLAFLDCSNNRIPFFRVRNMPNLSLFRCNNQRLDATRPKGSPVTGRRTLNLADIFGLSGRNSQTSPLRLLLGLITASDAETDSAPAEDYGFQYVRNVKAWDDDGQELSVEFDQSTGVITFSGLPAKFAYDFDTGFQNTLMDVSVFISEGDEDGNNGSNDNPSDGSNDNSGGTPTPTPAPVPDNSDNSGNTGDDTPTPEPVPAPENNSGNDNSSASDPGSSGGGCEAFGATALVSVLGLFLKKRR